MYSNFLERNDLFNFIGNSEDYTKENIDELETVASNSNISHRDFVNTIQKIFPFDNNTWIYTSHKALDKSPMNEIYPVERGLHPFRRYFAQLAHQHRTVNGNDEFNKKGLVVIPKFADSDLLSQARDEMKQFDIGVNKQPHNILYRNKDKAPASNSISEQTYEYIVKCLGGETPEIRNKFQNNTFIQRVHNKPDDKDHQKVAHVDTFFPAIKWWWFPNEVKLEHGPFNYAVNSCYPNGKYLDWILDQSIEIINDKWPRWKHKSHMEGSFRASDEELKSMGFDLKPITVKANTLVIANVAGFHSRGDVKKEYTRNAIHGSIRIDKPFEW